MCLITSPDASSGGCHLTCSSAADCPAGRACRSYEDVDLGDVTICEPFCASDDDCRSGRCNQWSAKCQAADAPEPTGAGISQACTGNDDCKSEFCALGECMTWCNVERDNCPAGSVCAPFEDGVDGACRVPCIDATDCVGLAATLCTPWNDNLDERYCFTL